MTKFNVSQKRDALRDRSKPEKEDVSRADLI
jgi:hypothetical protein